MFSEDQFAKYLQKDNVAVIGHSIGANTALVLAGGIPISYIDYMKQFGQTPHMGEETKKIDFITDNRIKAIVLLVLTPGWFTGEVSLKNVNISVLIFNAEKDDYIPDNQTKFFIKAAKVNPLIHCHIITKCRSFFFS